MKRCCRLDSCQPLRCSALHRPARAVALIWFVGPLIAIGELPAARPGSGCAPVLIGGCSCCCCALVALGVVEARKAHATQRAASTGDRAHGAAGERRARSASVAERSASSRRSRRSKASARQRASRRSVGAAATSTSCPGTCSSARRARARRRRCVNPGLHFPLAEQLGKDGVARRRRHAQLRLVVHRRGGADRHRRPLHHAGQRPARPTQRHGTASSALLEEYRPRQPINGVLVTVSVADLLQQAPPSASEHARHAARTRCRSCTSSSACACRSTCWSPRPTCSPASTSTSATLGKEERDAGLGLHASRRRRDSRATSRWRDFGARVRRAARSASTTRLHRRACSRSATCSSARAIFALPAAVRRRSGRCSATSSSRSSPASRFDERAAAARRLLHQRHAGRHARSTA